MTTRHHISSIYHTLSRFLSRPLTATAQCSSSRPAPPARRLFPFSPIFLIARLPPSRRITRSSRVAVQRPDLLIAICSYLQHYSTQGPVTCCELRYCLSSFFLSHHSLPNISARLLQSLPVSHFIQVIVISPSSPSRTLLVSPTCRRHLSRRSSRLRPLILLLLPLQQTRPPMQRSSHGRVTECAYQYCSVSRLILTSSIIILHIYVDRSAWFMPQV